MCKLFVGNLPYTVEKQDLEELASACGTVEYAVIKTDRDTGKSRGFGFIKMSSEEDMNKVLESLDGKEVGGRKINVSVSYDNNVGDIAFHNNKECSICKRNKSLVAGYDESILVCRDCASLFLKVLSKKRTRNRFDKK